MKKLGAFITDGFRASIEFPRFLRELDIESKDIIAALIGDATVFIKGGIITIDSGNTTITDGIIYKDGNYYSFIGGTFTGLPATLMVKFNSQTAAGYPVPYFGTTPVDIYKDNTAIIDVTGTISIDSIGTIRNLQYVKSKVDLVDGKAGKNAKAAVTGVTAGAGFTTNPAIQIFLEYEDGTIKIHTAVSFSGTKTTGSVLLTGLPDSGIFGKIVPVILNDASGNRITVDCELVGSQLKLFAPFNTPNNACLISFEYKKA